MKSTAKNVCLLLAFWLLPAVAIATPADLPDDLLQPKYQLDPGSLDESWRAILEPMRAHGGVRANFIENRFLRFRREPMELHGELRLDPELGLSLHYLPPEDTRLLIDDRGILMRDARGRSRTVPADDRTQAATAALLHVMRFDLAALSNHFELYGSQAGDHWRLLFEPTDASEKAGLHRILVEGSGPAVSTIQLQRSARQRIEINVGVPKTGVEFSAEERERFFR